MSEDITYCYNTKCKNLKCERHSSKIKVYYIPHSYGFFKECVCGIYQNSISLQVMRTVTTMKDDTISRAAALDALGERPTVWTDDDDYALGERNQYDMDRLAIETVPSAQPGQRNARVFQGIIVEYPSISAYPEYEGKPYFSIKYTENGQEFIGYGTYKPEVLSEYLKEYFMSPAQPNLSEAYSKAVFTWLMDYQIRAAELKGRYTPYEVLSWVANDWRKEHERFD